MPELDLLDNGVVEFLRTLPQPTMATEASVAGEQFVAWLKAKVAAGVAEWPEDDWYALGDAWDINLYLDDEAKPCATLYRVKDGKTVTSAPSIPVKVS